MTTKTHDVYLSYSEKNLDFVYKIALRLMGDARLTFWFQPWHFIKGYPAQKQMETALLKSKSCAIFVSPGGINQFQENQMRAAIEMQVTGRGKNYRPIPVLLPGVRIKDLPPFLREYNPVIFKNIDDEQAYKELIAGVLGIMPIEVPGYFQYVMRSNHLPAPLVGNFEKGRALVVGISQYPKKISLPDQVIHDAQDVYATLTDPYVCGYPQHNVHLLLDHQASLTSIRGCLDDLANKAGSDDTVIIFFSGHGINKATTEGQECYLLPQDVSLEKRAQTSLSGSEFSKALSRIKAGRLLVVLDCCHSGGASLEVQSPGDFSSGLNDAYYHELSQGRGRVVLAACEQGQVSLGLQDMRNSLYTHFFLEALRGNCKTMQDGHVRVFDVFRHVSEQVPAEAKRLADKEQTPVFKAIIQTDFPISLMPQ